MPFPWWVFSKYLPTPNTCSWLKRFLLCSPFCKSRQYLMFVLRNPESFLRRRAVKVKHNKIVKGNKLYSCMEISLLSYSYISLLISIVYHLVIYRASYRRYLAPEHTMAWGSETVSKSNFLCVFRVIWTFFYCKTKQNKTKLNRKG